MIAIDTVVYEFDRITYMRIGIDARFWSEQGHGRYLRNLIRELQKLDTENDYVLFLCKDDFDRVSFSNPKFTKVVADIRWYTVKEQTIFLKILLDAKLDLLHVPHFNVPIFYHKPYIITIHDLTITHFPSIRATTLPLPIWKIKRAMYHFVLKTAIKKAKKVIAVSEFTKDEILRFYPNTQPNKIVVTHEAVDQHFIEIGRYVEVDNPLVSEAKEKFGITKQYLLYIGNVHPHKNIERLIRVFNRLQNDLSGNIELVMVGKDNYFQKRLREETNNNKLGENIIWTGYVSDDYLIPLVKGAAAFVFPSLMEGFGIPPLEAMACGTPTVVSKTGSLPEVCGDASYFFNPEDQTDMYQKIKTVLNDPEIRATLIQHGHERVTQFSWQKMANETKGVYADATLAVV